MLARVGLRTRFLVLLLLGVLTVTAATLLVVRRAVESRIRSEIASDLQTSCLTFQAFQREREATLSHTAELLANLPTLKALMTTHDVATIQDASDETWRLSRSDLLLLASPTGQLMALHVKPPAVSPVLVQDALSRSANDPATKQWWFLDGHLYEVFLQPIYFGASMEDRPLGILALGYEINQALAADVSEITGSQVTFLYGTSVVTTTIDSSSRAELASAARDFAASPNLSRQDLHLAREDYLSQSVDLTPGASPGVRLNVVKSYDEATARFRGLYRMLTGLGIVSLLGLSLLAFGVFRGYTRPLEKLVAAVRALGQGDFQYPLEVRGQDELADATRSFIRMRDDLEQAQRKLLESERLATIGRMASSISHDLRHQLTSIVANSEFMSEADIDSAQSEELYQEIRDAVGRMTELIDSLLEFSKGRDALSPTYGSVEETMKAAIQSIHKHPTVQNVSIQLLCDGASQGWFDSRKLERAFYNLLLNACQAMAPNPGRIEVHVGAVPQGVEIEIRDSGPGVPAPLRDKIFAPFASYGKEHGTGLGLTIVQKIVEEHGGVIRLTNASPGQTTFSMMIPLGGNPETEPGEDVSSVSSDNIASAC